MKKLLCNKMVSVVLLAALILQAMPLLTFGAEAVQQPVYIMQDDIKADGHRGEQGYNGWYYMIKNQKGYVNMSSWDDSSNGQWNHGGNFINHFQQMPQEDVPTVIGWKAPYSGTVTVASQETLFRMSSNTAGGSVTASILLNDKVVDDGTTRGEWVFANTDSPTVHLVNYAINNIQVNAGDMIYHVIDCGSNNTAAAMRWRPKVSYTAYAEVVQNEATVYSMTDTKVLIAQYQNEKMLDVDIQELAANTIDTFPVHFLPDATKYKVFLWNNFSEMKPFTNAILYRPVYTDSIDIYFDGQEVTYSVLLVEDEPYMALEDVAEMTDSGTAVYQKSVDFTEAAGRQGYNGWYYMYQDSGGAFQNMKWNRANKRYESGGNNVNTHFIMPGNQTPSAIVWEAPYTGTVMLKTGDNTIYRSAANSGGGDVALTLRVNETEKWTATLNNAASNGNGTTYNLTEIAVNKGDKIYHIVDCGTNTASADVYWKPEITYTSKVSEQAENSLVLDGMKVTYYPESRLAEYADGHLILEGAPKEENGKLFIPLSSLIPTTGWTVEYQRFDNRIEISTGTNYPSAQRTIYVKDYGAYGDGIEDDRDAVLAAFNAAAGAGVPVKLEFEAGKTYRISEKQDSFALFDLDDVENFTLEGNGAKLLFETPTNSFINMERCTNVKVNNISVEYEEHVTTHGVIDSVDKTKGAITMTIPDGLPLPPNNLWASYWNPGEGPYIFGQVMEPTLDRLKFLTFDHLWISDMVKVSGRTYQVILSNPSESALNQIAIGDRFVYKRRWTAYDFGETNKYGRPDFLCVTESKDITFDGVKTTGSLLMFAPVSRNDGRITFKNCELMLKPGALITTNADGIHATNNRFGIIVENCTFRNSLDDFINTNQHAAKVLKKEASNILEVSGDLFYRIGDEMKFFDKDNHTVLGKAFLTDVQKIETEVTEGLITETVVTYQLTLDRDIEFVTADETGETSTLLYNMNAANQGNIVRNNTFLNGRRHAYIIRSANTLVENNYMENNGGSAIEAANEIHGESNEGLMPSTLNLIGNTIVGDGITAEYSPLRVYSWNAVAGEEKAIDGVLLEGNTIDVRSAQGAIKVSHVNDLYMLNNTITCGDELSTSAVPMLISDSKVNLFDGLKYYLTNASVAVRFKGCEVLESSIANITAGGNTVTHYEIVQ